MNNTDANNHDFSTEKQITEMRAERDAHIAAEVLHNLNALKNIKEAIVQWRTTSADVEEYILTAMEVKHAMDFSCKIIENLGLLHEQPFERAVVNAKSDMDDLASMADYTFIHERIKSRYKVD